MNRTRAGASAIPFEFAAPQRIIFGAGRAREVGQIAASFCPPGEKRRAFMVTGRRALREAGVLDRLVGTLTEAGFSVTTFAVSGEPTVSLVDHGLEAAKKAEPSVLIALGGGSVIDTGKAIAGLLTNGGTTIDYLEGVGSGRALQEHALPLIAMPTTAGTGSEATKNAVITADDGRFKKSMRSDHLLPRVALVDPTLTYTAPPDVTAFSGLDALTQLIEPYTSNRACVLTDAIAEQGIRLVARSLLRAYQHPTDVAARADMAVAALFGGMCLANAGLGAVHGIASSLGALYPIPHGAGCGALLPHVVELNIRRLRKEDTRHPTLAKYRFTARTLGPKSSDPLHDLPHILRDLVARLRVPGLGSWGMKAEGIPAVVKGSRGSSMRYNPVVLHDDELAAILKAAM